jgi:hypothetical protein
MYVEVEPAPAVGGTPPPQAPPAPKLAKPAGQPWFLAILSVPVLLVLCLLFGVGGLALAAGMGMFSTPEPTAIPTRRPTRTPIPTAVPSALFEDDFETEANDWSTAEDDTSRRSFRDGEYVMEVLDGAWIIWSTPDMDEVSHVNVAVTVTNYGGEDATFGVICNFQGNDAFYYLGFGEDGYYAIVRVDGDEDTVLTSEENLWEKSEAIAEFEGTYELDADCADDGTLRLKVDGVTIAEVQDDTYTEGTVGFFVRSFEDLPVEVGFDNLSVTELED